MLMTEEIKQQEKEEQRFKELVKKKKKIEKRINFKENKVPSERSR
jgi:hypothetical protein